MKPYLKVTIAYLIFGVLWIFLSDHVTALQWHDVSAVTHVQTLKGWFYVAISGMLIYILTKRAFMKQAAAEKEKLAVFKKTVEGAHHILLNYLNQMQLVTLEAEQSLDFDQEVLTLSKSLTEEAADALKKLHSLDLISPDSIDVAIHGRTRS
jgi:isoleucyl-tRNA synthetase